MQPHNFSTTESVIHIKNMVSRSCIRVVKESLEKTGFIKVLRIELGEAQIRYDGQIATPQLLNEILQKEGFELIEDNSKKLIERIKTSVIQLIFYGSNTNSIIRNSDYLSDRLGHPYAYLSKLFSEKTNSTLEKYIILIKIEKIKELISYGEMTLSEIAFQMGYSSVQYLSNQFRQVTGLSVTEYKSLRKRDRKPLSAILD